AGAWTLTTRPLHDGCYRAVAMAFSRALQTPPGLTIVPMVPFGRFTYEGEYPPHALAPTDGGRSADRDRHRLAPDGTRVRGVRTGRSGCGGIIRQGPVRRLWPGRRRTGSGCHRPPGESAR